MLLQEVLEVRRDGHHASVERVNASLHAFLVCCSRLALHLLGCLSDFFLVDLDLCQSVLDSDVQLRDLVFLGGKQRLVSLHYIHTKNIVMLERVSIFL